MKCVCSFVEDSVRRYGIVPGPPGYVRLKPTVNDGNSDSAGRSGHSPPKTGEPGDPHRPTTGGGYPCLGKDTKDLPFWVTYTTTTDDGEQLQAWDLGMGGANLEDVSWTG
ncbi:hypothetical protein VTJ04DRAFT_8043 [Mycothermus thermophilus]|uniref:uncharacterized protein n=1 Tax=Humicola insolens TaxID=85995 RepID=UPI0037445B30